MRKSIYFLAAAALAMGFATAAVAAPVTSPATVRSGPSKKWPVIATIPAGADVQVLDCGGGWKRDWCQVRYGATTGFVAAGVLAPSGRSNVVVAPVQTLDDAKIYSGPSPKYRVIGVAPAGVVVNKGACIYGWRGSWCQINHAGKVGYVMEGLLQREGALFPM